MGQRDLRFDAYIGKAQPFAKPILEHIRQLTHKACPDVRETIKWGHLFFEYKDGNLCMMAGFKQHCTFGFWLQKEMKDPADILQEGANKEAHGQLGRLTTVGDLPSDKILNGYIKEAMSLIDSGVKLARPKAEPKAETEVPDYLIAALKKDKAAKAGFQAFGPGARREYIQWLEEAKTEATRTKRLETALEWIAEGKTRNWKYQKK